MQQVNRSSEGAVCSVKFFFSLSSSIQRNGLCDHLEASRVEKQLVNWKIELKNLSETEKVRTERDIEKVFKLNEELRNEELIDWSGFKRTRSGSTFWKCNQKLLSDSEIQRKWEDDDPSYWVRPFHAKGGNQELDNFKLQKLKKTNWKEWAKNMFKRHKFRN